MSLLLLKEISYNGVGMLEYKVNNDKAYLMELNGRFWGSMELGKIAGLDIVNNAIKSFYYGEKLKKEESSKRVYSRNFKLSIRYMFDEMLKRKTLKPFFRLLYNLLKLVGNNNMVLEDSLFKDVKVEIAYYLQFVNYITKKIRNNLVSIRNIKNKNTPLLNNGDMIVFVCRGNICRSPFAELYVKQCYGYENVISCGFDRREGRMSLQNAIVAASNYGVDMKEHKSRYIKEDLVKKADYIFIMDKANYIEFKNLYRDYINKVYLLGGKKEIRDPYKSSVENYINTYKMIKERVDVIMSKILSKKENIG